MTGIREARIVQPEREGKDAIPEPVRMIFDLPASAISGTIQRGQWFLPLHTGAGPCGTLARVRQRIEVRVDAKMAAHSPLGAENYMAAEEAMLRPRILGWSVEHLVEPLRAYYAAYEPPRRFGAKDTPRGRRFA